MRIGLFTDMYLPHVSGVTNHARLYKRHYEDLGHEVFLFTFGDLDYPDLEPNVIRTPGLPWGRTGWRFAPTFCPEARRLIPTLDIAHVHHPFLSGVLALRECRRHRVPVVLTNHTRYDLYSDAYARFVPRALRHAFLRISLKRITAACDLVVAPAPSIRDWLAEYCGFEDAVVVPNGIDVERFANPEHPVSRRELGFSSTDVVFCYAGRLGPEKNTEWLAEEFARAAERTSNAHLLVIGDGPSRPAAEAALAAHGFSDRATFLGMRPYEDLPALEAAADAFVTGSISEVHPLVVLEALAAGLPVIAVRSPGISDTVTDDESGLLAPAVAQGALADRIVAFTADPELRARLSSGSRRAARGYSFEQTADVLLGHYERLAG